MNLLTDKWIPVLRVDGPDKIAPWQIVAPENPVIEINAPRPDFQGALYQFLIGLLQTFFAPEDEDEWRHYWNKVPSTDVLNNVFSNQDIKIAFELHNPDGPAFLQDFDLSEGEEKNLLSLLIDFPGGKTLRDNIDHFVKHFKGNGLCGGCTATALFTLQTNAPSGGVGHRVGIRGGGPLTTLIIPKETNTSLWRKIWINILNREDNSTFIITNTIKAAVMPWLGPTRISDKLGVATTPDDCHALQVYWGMPRRIRLKGKGCGGTCDVCGEKSNYLFKTYITKNYGIDYTGAWVHPLTPYRVDETHRNPPISLKGQKGGLGYRHWLGLSLQEADTGDKSATVVQFYNDERGPSLFKSQSAALWCFGYDMDNMKARCWYDTRFPLFSLDERQKENLMVWSGELIGSAKEVVKILRPAVKSAWFKRPGDVKGDMSSVERQFWETTEPRFYNLLEDLAELSGETRMPPPEIYSAWFRTLERTMFDIFEKETLYSNPEETNLKRIITSKQFLTKKFYNNNAIKSLITKAKVEAAQ